MGCIRPPSEESSFSGVRGSRRKHVKGPAALGNGAARAVPGRYHGQAGRLLLMPSWLFPAALTGGISLLTGALAVIWAEIKSSEARTAKQLDALRDDLKANEARQREEMREMRADMKALGEKMDRLVEGMMTVRK